MKKGKVISKVMWFFKYQQYSNVQGKTKGRRKVLWCNWPFFSRVERGNGKAFYFGASNLTKSSSCKV